MEKAAQFLESLPFIAEVPETSEVFKELPKDNSKKDEDMDKDINEDSNVVDEINEDHSEDEGPKEYIFKLDIVPGADGKDEDFINEDKDVAVQEVKEPEHIDEWDWEKRGLSSFLDWLQDRFQNIPKHSGHDTTGVERALAYFQRLDGEITRAMRKDYKREIDAAKAEQARTEIMKGMDRLIERLEGLQSKKFKKSKSLKKAASINYKMLKTAETATTGHIVITVDYLISHIARTCIEATVQGGRDIEDVFDKLSSEYSLNKREKAEVKQLLRDMGYSFLVDRVNPGKNYQPGSNSVSEFITQYYA